MLPKLGCLHVCCLQSEEHAWEDKWWYLIDDWKEREIYGFQNAEPFNEEEFDQLMADNEQWVELDQTW